MKNICIFISVSFLCCLTGSQNLWGQCIDPDQIDTGVPCTAVPDPVCGCDEVTYVNACQAENWYGITEWTVGPCPDQCQADFLFVYLNGQDVLFYNNSINFTDHEWEIDGQIYYSDADGLLHYTIGVTPTLVCLRISNTAGCEDEYCVYVHPNAPEEMCNISDCVWPGDANGNWRPNNYDLINIGLGFDAEGPERPFFPFPEDHIQWAPNYADLWSGYTGGLNQKHLDCDGNGKVEESDIEAIYHNYDPETNTQTTPTVGAPDLWLDFGANDLIIIDLNSPSEIELVATLRMGDASNTVTNLHGLAFTIEFPDTLVTANSTTFNYLNNSFFGYNYDVLTVSRELDDFIPGRFDAALSRKSGNGVSGSGALAEIKFIVNSDIIGGRAVPETPFDVILDNVIMVNSEGDTMTYNLPIEPARVIFLNTGISTTGDHGFAQKLKVFPNPVRDLLTIESPEVSLESIRLINHLGQQVWQQEVQGNRVQIPTNSWPTGVYLLEAFSVEERVLRKVVLE